METKVKKIILIHGFKRHGKDDFEFLKKHFLKKFKNINFISFDFYENNNKKSINHKLFKKKIEQIFYDNKNEKISIIGYSVGALASITLTNKFNNIDKIYSLYPSIKINFFDWIKKIFTNTKSNRKIKKKIGKEQFKKIKNRFTENKFIEKHPIKMIHEINKFINKSRKNLKKINNKKINIVFSDKDEIVNVKKSQKYLNKKIDFSKNNIIFSKNNFNHFNILKFDNTKIFTEIENYLELK